MRALATLGVCCMLLVAACARQEDAATYVARATDQMAAKDYAHAIIELKNALRIDAKNNQARVMLGECYMNSGLPKDALAELDGMPEQHASAEVEDTRIRARLALGQFDAALRTLDEAGSKISEAAASVYRGQALQGLQRFDESDEAFQKALDDGDTTAWPKALLIENLALRGNLVGAAAAADTLTNQYPQSAHAWLIKGNVAARSRDLSQAESAWIKADALSAELSAQQRNALSFSLAEARLTANDLGGAQRYRDRLVQTPSGRILGEFIGARILFAQRKYPDVIAKLREVLGMARDFKPASQLLAAALLADGHAAEAEVQLKEMLTSDPNNVELRKLLARARLRQGRPRDAMMAIEPALTRQSDDSDLNALATLAPLQLADLAVDEDDWKHAAAWLEESRARDPSQFDARVALAYLYFKRGRLDEADAIMSEASNLAGDSAQRWQSVGSVYMNAGQLPAALKAFTEATQKQGANARTWLMLARTQLMLANEDGAKGSVRKALKISPKSLASNGLYAVIQAREGDLKGGLKTLQDVNADAAQANALKTWEGEVYVAAKQYVNAANAYEQALAAGGGREVAIKATQARREANLKPYYAPLAKWRASHADDIGVAMLLAQEYAAAGERQSAIGEYESILRTQAKNIAALNNLAWLYQQGADPKALQTARKAYSLADKSPLIADTYGWILLEQGKVTEAAPILKSAADAAPNHADIQFHYAAALARSGEREQAAQIVRALLASHPRFESRSDAERLLAQLGER